MTFKPTQKIPRTLQRNIRVNYEDWLRIEEIAKNVNISMSEVTRQALHYAMEAQEER